MLIEQLFDVKGGMNVILEVSVPDVVKALADIRTLPDGIFLPNISNSTTSGVRKAPL